MEALVFVGSTVDNQIKFGKLSSFSRQDFKDRRLFEPKRSKSAKLLDSGFKTNKFKVINIPLLRIFNQLFESSLTKADVEIENVLFVVPVRPQVSLL
jgi:hypothetical protein